MSRQEIQQNLRLKGRANFEERYLKPALAEGFIGMTIPEKPQSRLQRYRLTAKGNAWLDTQRKKVRKILADPDSPNVPPLEAEMDHLVYELYGLTEEEIGIVEGRKDVVAVGNKGKETIVLG